MTATSETADVWTTVRSAIEAIRKVAEAEGRSDFVASLGVALDRVRRPETAVAVAGEFKQGKSSLVNGLLGQPVCPVDDDMATAVVTVLRHGDFSATAWRQEGGQQVRLDLSLEQLPLVISEAGNPNNIQQIGVVDLQIPNPFLESGLILIDTPGVGGLGPGRIETTLGYLQAADAALVVSDATAPLTAAELTFLRSAVSVCPNTALVLSKTDIAPGWQQVLELNRTALTDAGIDVPIVPVSSLLRVLALERHDATLNGESGFPQLLNFISTDVMDRSRERAANRGRDQAEFAASQMQRSLEQELRTLDDASSIESAVAALDQERQRLETLRSASARWQTTMTDQFSDLISNVEHAFRQRIRLIGRDAETAIEDGDPANDWEVIAATARDRVAEAAIAVVREMEAGADEVAKNIVLLLKEEELRLAAALGKASPADVRRLTLGLGQIKRPASEVASTGWASLRGAQSGILVIGMLGSLAGLVLSTGVLVGIGAVFGGKQIFEERKRQTTQRRQKARTAIRQYLDDAQFEVGKSMRDLARELQRQIRDHFSERIAESVRTCTATTQALQQAAQQTQATRDQRIAEVNSRLQSLLVSLQGLPRRAEA